MVNKLTLPINDVKVTASWKTESYRKKFGFEHYGIDMVSISGKTYLYGLGDGIVIACGTDSVLGKFIVVKYYNALNKVSGLAADVICRMWHLSKVSVNKNDKVDTNVLLGFYGNTGQNTTGAHLHIEMDTDVKYPMFTPTLKWNTANFIGRNPNSTGVATMAVDTSMRNPLEWMYRKITEPENQTYTTTNDAYIRVEDLTCDVMDNSVIPPSPPSEDVAIEGIDVSVHNNVVDFEKVKAAGKEFVFIRIGWAGFDGPIDLNNAIDARFHENMKRAKDAGLKVGVYLYSYCLSETAARVAAKEVLELVKPYKLEYPIAFDIESTSENEPSGAHYNKKSKSFNTSIVKAFLNEITNAGYTGMLYTYKSFAENYLNISDLTEWDTWIAHYAKVNTYKGGHTIWQYKGDVVGFTGSCPGVVGPCDLNVSYKDYSLGNDIVDPGYSEQAIKLMKDLEQQVALLEYKNVEIGDNIEALIDLDVESDTINPIYDNQRKLHTDINKMLEDTISMVDKYS